MDSIDTNIGTIREVSAPHIPNRNSVLICFWLPSAGLYQLRLRIAPEEWEILANVALRTKTRAVIYPIKSKNSKFNRFIELQAGG